MEDYRPDSQSSSTASGTWTGYHSSMDAPGSWDSSVGSRAKMLMMSLSTGSMATSGLKQFNSGKIPPPKPPRKSLSSSPARRYASVTRSTSNVYEHMPSYRTTEMPQHVGLNGSLPLSVNRKSAFKRVIKRDICDANGGYDTMVTTTGQSRTLTRDSGLYAHHTISSDDYPYFLDDTMINSDSMYADSTSSYNHHPHYHQPHQHQHPNHHYSQSYVDHNHGTSNAAAVYASISRSKGNLVDAKIMEFERMNYRPNDEPVYAVPQRKQDAYRNSTSSSSSQQAQSQQQPQHHHHHQSSQSKLLNNLSLNFLRHPSSFETRSNSFEFLDVAYDSPVYSSPLSADVPPPPPPAKFANDWNQTKYSPPAAPPPPKVPPHQTALCNQTASIKKQSSVSVQYREEKLKTRSTSESTNIASWASSTSNSTSGVSSSKSARVNGNRNPKLKAKSFACDEDDYDFALVQQLAHPDPPPPSPKSALKGIDSVIRPLYEEFKKLNTLTNGGGHDTDASTNNNNLCWNNTRNSRDIETLTEEEIFASLLLECNNNTNGTTVENSLLINGNQHSTHRSNQQHYRGGGTNLGGKAKTKNKRISTDPLLSDYDDFVVNGKVNCCVCEAVLNEKILIVKDANQKFAGLCRGSKRSGRGTGGGSSKTNTLTSDGKKSLKRQKRLLLQQQQDKKNNHHSIDSAELLKSAAKSSTDGNRPHSLTIMVSKSFDRDSEWAQIAEMMESFNTDLEEALSTLERKKRDTAKRKSTGKIPRNLFTFTAGDEEVASTTTDTKSNGTNTLSKTGTITRAVKSETIELKKPDSQAGTASVTIEPAKSDEPEKEPEKPKESENDPDLVDPPPEFAQQPTPELLQVESSTTPASSSISPIQIPSISHTPDSIDGPKSRGISPGLLSQASEIQESRSQNYKYSSSCSFAEGAIDSDIDDQTTVEDWFQRNLVALVEYSNLLVAHGFDELRFMGPRWMDNQDLMDVGINNPLHRELILEAAKTLPDKPLVYNLEDLSVDEWLNLIKLRQYKDTFRENSYTSMIRVMKLWEVELNTVLSIKKAGHRKRILVSLQPSNEKADEASVSSMLLSDFGLGDLDLDNLNLTERFLQATSSSTEPSQVDNKKPSPAPSQSTTITVSESRKSEEPPPIQQEAQPSSNNLSNEWKHTPDEIKSGVPYTAQYLGSTLVKELAETESTVLSIKKLKHSTKDIMKIPSITLKISHTGVKFIDAETKSLVCEHEIKNIHWACQDPDDLRHLAYITKETESGNNYCHVFRADSIDLATDILLTLGQAFDVAYQIALSGSMNCYTTNTTTNQPSSMSTSIVSTVSSIQDSASPDPYGTLKADGNNVGPSSQTGTLSSSPMPSAYSTSSTTHASSSTAANTLNRSNEKPAIPANKPKIMPKPATLTRQTTLTRK